MKISELEELLKKTRDKEGDLKVIIDSMAHSWPPDPAVRERGERVLVLNS